VPARGRELNLQATGHAILRRDRSVINCAQLLIKLYTESGMAMAEPGAVIGLGEP
jgi:hypothetical protein